MVHALREVPRGRSSHRRWNRYCPGSLDRSAESRLSEPFAPCRRTAHSHPNQGSSEFLMAKGWEPEKSGPLAAERREEMAAWESDRKSTRLNSSHVALSRMPS